MNNYDESIKLILESNQLILRNRRFAFEDDQEKAKVIDEQITRLLNPQEETLQDKMKCVNLGEKEK